MAKGKDAGRLELPPGLADQVLARAGDAVVIVDATRAGHPAVYVNEAFERLTGHPAAAVIGRNPAMLQGPDTDPVTVARVREAMQRRHESRTTLVNYRADGSTFWNEMYLYPLLGADGRPRHWVGLLRDVSARVEHEERVASLAYTDELTGLANRALLRQHLTLALARARRYDRFVALLFIDLDGFKQVNDAFGHDTGDELLRRVADRLKAVTRSSDLLARHGGDEFLLLVTDIDRDPERLGISLAHNLIDALTEPFQVEQLELTARASVGISVFPRDADDGAVLLRHADAAMYQAKRSGGGVRLHTAEPHGEMP